MPEKELGSITSEEHRKILKLMQSQAYRDEGHKQHSAVSATVRAFFAKNSKYASPVGLGASQSPLPASRTPDPTRRKGVA